MARRTCDPRHAGAGAVVPGPTVERYSDSDMLPAGHAPLSEAGIPALALLLAAALALAVAVTALVGGALAWMDGTL